MKNDILIINGPNLNMLGTREPDVYGLETLEQIEAKCISWGKQYSLHVNFSQSNEEGKIVNLIQQAPDSFSAIIINAGAYTHTSIAIHDALKGCDLPIIEVHLSNIFKREAFRHNSYISGTAEGLICGFGSESYHLAIIASANLLKSQN